MVPYYPDDDVSIPDNSRMTWRYQATEKDGLYMVREVYAGNDMRTMWTVDGVAPIGDSREELIAELKIMLADVEKYPVLHIGDNDEHEISEP